MSETIKLMSEVTKLRLELAAAQARISELDKALREAELEPSVLLRYNILRNAIRASTEIAKKP